MTSLYDFTVSDQADQPVSLQDYKGKIVLIVNTATGCGLTPQYQGLQELYDKYKDQGFEILDFPCNQFMGQAPGSAEEINSFCTLNYHTTFPRFAKIKVNGKEAEPLFDWLKQEKSGPLGARIEWNFAKFLINREGKVVERFSSKTDPLKWKMLSKLFLITKNKTRVKLERQSLTVASSALVFCVKKNNIERNFALF